MKNDEKAKELANDITEHGGKWVSDREVYEGCIEMAQWKDEQVKQLLIEKTKLLSPSAAQDSVKRCMIEEIYREMFNEEIPNSNTYMK